LEALTTPLRLQLEEAVQQAQTQDRPQEATPLRMICLGCRWVKGRVAPFHLVQATVCWTWLVLPADLRINNLHQLLQQLRQHHSHSQRRQLQLLSRITIHSGCSPRHLHLNRSHQLLNPLDIKLNHRTSKPTPSQFSHHPHDNRAPSNSSSQSNRRPSKLNRPHRFSISNQAMALLLLLHLLRTI